MNPFLLIFLIVAILGIVVVIINFVSNERRIGVILPVDRTLGKREYSGIAKSVYTAISEYAKEKDIESQIVYKDSDGTSATALKLVEELYNSGIRKIIGPLYSEEIYGDVEIFVARHPDLLMINGSATSTILNKEIPNLFYFIPNDTTMAKHMASLVKLRILATHIAIVYRNDDWGTPYKNVLAPLLGKFLRSSVIESFGYDLESLSTVVTSVETFIAHKQRPCVIFLGFEEIGNYLDLVKDNATFRRATHFGVGDVSFNTEMLTTYFEFLQHVQFEYLYYYGDKSGTDKRYDIIKNFSGNKTLRGGNFSMYTYPYYDAIKCINELCTGSTKATKFKSKLKDYYGVTGYIELENSRRVRGLSKSARYVSNEKEETVMSSVGILDLMEVSGYDTVKANNKYETYEVHFTSEVSFPVSITVLSGCDFIESYTINNVDEYMTLSAMDDITVSYGNSVYVVSSAVGTNTYRSLNGVRVVEGHEEQFINCMVPTNFTLVFSNEKIIGTSYYGGDGAGPSDLDGILA